MSGWAGVSARTKGRERSESQHRQQRSAQACWRDGRRASVRPRTTTIRPGFVALRRRPRQPIPMRWRPCRINRSRRLWSDRLGRVLDPDHPPMTGRLPLGPDRSRRGNWPPRVDCRLDRDRIGHVRTQAGARDGVRCARPQPIARRLGASCRARDRRLALRQS